MVGGVAGKVHGRGGQLTNVKRLVIVKQLVDDLFVFLPRNTIFLAKQLLDLSNALPDADGGLLALGLGEARLEIGSGREVVCMSVSLEDSGDGVGLFRNQGEQCISGLGGDGLGDGVVVEDRVNDYGSRGGRISDDVLPCAGFWFKDVVNRGFIR